MALLTCKHTWQAVAWPFFAPASSASVRRSIYLSHGEQRRLRMVAAENHRQVFTRDETLPADAVGMPWVSTGAYGCSQRLVTRTEKTSGAWTW